MIAKSISSRSRITFVLLILILVLILSAMFTGERKGPAPSQLGPPKEKRVYTPFNINSAGRVIGLFLLGITSGLIGGMLGLGGGVMKVSSLVLFFGSDVELARTVALITYFVTAASASYRHSKYRLAVWDVVKLLIPASIFGVFIGTCAGNHLNRETLTKLLGLFVLFVSIYMWGQLLSRKKEGEERAFDQRIKGEKEWKIALIGLPKGFFCGILGISGGVICTPLQRLILNIPLKNAIANTLFSAMFSVAVAMVLSLSTGISKGFFDIWTPILASLCIVPGAAIGSQLGALATNKLSLTIIRLVFAIATLLMALEILI